MPPLNTLLVPQMMLRSNEIFIILAVLREACITSGRPFPCWGLAQYAVASKNRRSGDEPLATLCPM